MKVLKLFFLAAILIMASCANNSRIPVIDNAKDYPEIDMDLNEIADIRFVRLGGEEEGFITNIIHGVFVDDINGLIVVRNLSSSGSGIGIFDKDGEFVRQIGRCGNGPGEYHNAIHLLVRPEKKRIIVFDQNTSRFIAYDYDGNYLPDESKQTDLNFFASVVLLDGKYVCFNNHSSYFNWRKKSLEKTGRTLRAFDADTFSELAVDDISYAEPYNAEVVASTFATYTKNGALLLAPQCDTVWQVDRQLRLTPKFVWTTHNDQQSVIFPYMETDDYIFCSTETNNPDYANDLRHFAIRKSDNAVLTIKTGEPEYYAVKNLLEGKMFLTSFSRSMNYNYCYKCVQYGTLRDLYDLLDADTRRMVDSMTEESNPMLMLIRFK